jgi:2-haloacid dehalogenase
MVQAGGPQDRVRAADRRPRAVLLDVFETVLRVAALRERFVDVGRPAHECELFFARTLRDGMALTLAGGVRPFSEVAWPPCAPRPGTRCPIRRWTT